MGKPKTTIQAPQATPEQTELARLQLQLIQQQMAQADDPLVQQINQLGQQQLLNLLQGKPQQLSPEQEANISTVFGTQREEGTEDISRFARELAGRRGMNLTDSPVGGEVLRQQQNLLRGLGASEAATRLQLPIDQQRFATQTFQSMQQLANQNRAALLGTSFGSPTGIATTAGGGLGSTLGGVGGLLGGLGTAMPFFSALGGLFSSARFKESLVPVSDQEHLSALRAVREMPLYHWKYKGQQEEHVGPITEQAPPEIVSQDKAKLMLADALGLTLSAVKALDEKVQQLEEKVG